MLQTIINSQFYGMRIDEAVADLRIHHQLLPPELKFEEGLAQVSASSRQIPLHDVNVMSVYITAYITHKVAL